MSRAKRSRTRSIRFESKSVHNVTSTPNQQKSCSLIATTESPLRVATVLQGETMKQFTKIAATVLLIAAVTGYCFAQGSAESSVRGNLAGTVVDSSGAVVTGAKVTINGATGTKSDTTNQDGQFLFPLLTPGFYSVKVEKGSFKTADVKGIEVVTGKTSNVRVGMVAGQATEVVEVQGNAITVDTTSTAV